MPGLKAAEIDGRLEAAGIEMVYVVCVNDGAVMTAWKKDMGLAGSELIEFVADTDADLTEALGLVLTGGRADNSATDLRVVLTRADPEPALRARLTCSPQGRVQSHSAACAVAERPLHDSCARRRRQALWQDCRPQQRARLPHEAVQALRDVRRRRNREGDAGC